eukprot:CFRG7122T1
MAKPGTPVKFDIFVKPKSLSLTSSSSISSPPLRFPDSTPSIHQKSNGSEERKRPTSINGYSPETPAGLTLDLNDAWDLATPNKTSPIKRARLSFENCTSPEPPTDYNTDAKRVFGIPLEKHPSTAPAKLSKRHIPESPVNSWMISEFDKKNRNTHKLTMRSHVNDQHARQHIKYTQIHTKKVDLTLLDKAHRRVPNTPAVTPKRQGTTLSSAAIPRSPARARTRYPQQSLFEEDDSLTPRINGGSGRGGPMKPLSRYREEFEQVSKLGSGSFGNVYLCYRRLDKAYYAIKKFKTQPIHREVYAHAAISAFGDSPHVVRYHTSWVEDDEMHIQNEYCNMGNLSDFIGRRKERPCQHMLTEILWQLAEGLKFIHGHGIVHMDLKPKNIFVKAIYGNEEYNDHKKDEPDSPVVHRSPSIQSRIHSSKLQSNGKQNGNGGVTPPSARKLNVNRSIAKHYATSKNGDPELEGSKHAQLNHDQTTHPVVKYVCAICHPDQIHAGSPKFLYKLGDFGHAVSSQTPDVANEGDCRYLAPEILADDFRDLRKADIFGLGLLLYGIAIAQPLPRNGSEWTDLREGRFKKIPQCSVSFCELIRSMCTPDLTNRPTAEDIASEVVKGVQGDSMLSPGQLADFTRALTDKTKALEKRQREVAALEVSIMGKELDLKNRQRQALANSQERSAKPTQPTPTHKHMRGTAFVKPRIVTTLNTHTRTHEENIKSLPCARQGTSAHVQSTNEGIYQHPPRVLEREGGTVGNCEDVDLGAEKKSSAGTGAIDGRLSNISKFRKPRDLPRQGAPGGYGLNRSMSTNW